MRFMPRQQAPTGATPPPYVCPLTVSAVPLPSPTTVCAPVTSHPSRSLTRSIKLPLLWPTSSDPPRVPCSPVPRHEVGIQCSAPRAATRRRPPRP